MEQVRRDPAGAPINRRCPKNYRDSWSLAGGVDYAVSPALTLRAGVQHATTPTRNGQRDARVPDSNRWNYGAGATFNVTSRFSIDAAGNYVDFKNAPIDRITAAYAGTAAQTPILTNGRLVDAHAFIASLVAASASDPPGAAAGPGAAAAHVPEPPLNIAFRMHSARLA